MPRAGPKVQEYSAEVKLAAVPLSRQRGVQVQDRPWDHGRERLDTPRTASGAGHTRDAITSSPSFRSGVASGSPAAYARSVKRQLEYAMRATLVAFGVVALGGRLGAQSRRRTPPPDAPRPSDADAADGALGNATRRQCIGSRDRRSSRARHGAAEHSRQPLCLNRWSHSSQW